MLWLKAFHIVFVVTWFAGLFYLPRVTEYTRYRVLGPPQPAAPRRTRQVI